MNSHVSGSINVSVAYSVASTIKYHSDAPAACELLPILLLPAGGRNASAVLPEVFRTICLIRPIHAVSPAAVAPAPATPAPTSTSPAASAAAGRGLLPRVVNLLSVQETSHIKDNQIMFQFVEPSCVRFRQGADAGASSSWCAQHEPDWAARTCLLHASLCNQPQCALLCTNCSSYQDRTNTASSCLQAVG
jgi:hypothetical protein